MSGDPNKNLNSDELSYDGDMGKSPLNLASKVASRKSPDFGGGYQRPELWPAQLRRHQLPNLRAA